MIRCFLLLLLVLAPACSPSLPQVVAPSPGAEASSTPFVIPTATQTLSPTPVPTPMGGGGGSLLLLDGPSLYRLDFAGGAPAESRIASIQDLLPPELSFDPLDSFYSAEFSPDAETLFLILHSNADETDEHVILARRDGSRSVSLPLDLQDRLDPTIVWAPDSSGMIVRLAEKFFTNTGPEHWVISARPGDFGGLVQWEPSTALFWSGDGQKIYWVAKGGETSVALRDGSQRTDITFSGDTCGNSWFGIASPEAEGKAERIYLMCGFETLLEAGPNGEDARRIDVEIHPGSEVIYWSSAARQVVISNGAVWSAFPQVTVYDTVRGASQVTTLDDTMTVPCGLSPDGRFFTYLADYFEVPSVRAYDLEAQETITIYHSKQKENARQLSCPGWVP